MDPHDEVLRDDEAFQQEISRIERPHRDLLIYYGLFSLVLGPFFFVLLLPLFFRYNTLRYRFDEEGVSMSWGLLFRREIHLTYSRIQDIHLVSNIVERWLGLARIQIQTASGSSKAEMTLEGLKEFARVRDFLYSRMRGTREEDRHAGARAAVGNGAGGISVSAETISELTATLRDVATELRALRSPEAGAPSESSVASSVESSGVPPVGDGDAS